MAYSFQDTFAEYNGDGGLFAIGSTAGTDEEGISYSIVGNTNEMKAGNDSIMHSLRSVMPAEITLNLLKTSPTNKKLQDCFNLQRLDSQKHGSAIVTIVNTGLGDQITLRKAAFKRLSDNGYKMSGNTLIWVLQGEINIMLGDLITNSDAIRNGQSSVTVSPPIASSANLPPIAGFEANPIIGIGPMDVQFADLSLRHPTSWAWDFGDGGTSMQQNPSHTYDAVIEQTDYSVTLTVSNQYGQSSATGLIRVNVQNQPSFAVDFDVNFSSTCGAVIFTDKSVGVSSWMWDFGDGNTSTDQNPTHAYGYSYDFNVVLTVTYTNSQQDSKSITVTVYQALGFNDYYQMQGLLNGIESNWIKHFTGISDGNIDRPIDGNSIVFTGPSSNIPGLESIAWVVIQANSTGLFRFNWSYTNSNVSTNDDIAGFVLGGTEFVPALFELARNSDVTLSFDENLNPIITPATGSVSVNVNFGDWIGFYVKSITTNDTPGMLTITCFDAPLAA